MSQINPVEHRGRVPPAADINITVGLKIIGHEQELACHANISLLPNELLGFIFDIAHIATPFERTTKLPTEVLISHVCQHWRNLALALPELWSNITLPCSNPKGLERSLTYLKRTSQYPLDLLLDFRARGGSHGEPEEIIWLTVLDHATRWRSLTVRLSSAHGLASTSIALQDISVPLLERFEVVSSVSSPLGPASQRIFGGGAPSLRWLRVTNIPFQQCRPPLLTLTKLELCLSEKARLSGMKFVGLLKSVPSLKYLSLGGGVVNGLLNPVVAGREIVEMPHLLEFQLADPRMVLSYYLALVSAPQLHTLVLHDVADDISQRTIPTIRGNYPALHTLTLVDPHYSLFFITPIQKALPTVVHFNVMQADSESLTQTILDDIAQCEAVMVPDDVGNDHGGGVIGWPDLKSITYAPPPHRLDMLFKLVLTRAAAGCPLMSLTLPGPHDTKDVHRLRLGLG
ncbi:hypothetical protein BD779DRAFT_200589 [Infundibulicybe gibba]|nr:hypothetical protein BD779DRAFT_200589 [Infundibulicybe gibba]